MNWFSKIRNTTGHSISTNVAGATYGSNSVRPVKGQLQTHTALPTAAMLAPRVDNLTQAGLKVDKAKEYLAQCERPVVHHPGPLNARTEGRTKQFFKSAANATAKAVGMGRVSTPPVQSQWTRPDEHTPVKLNIVDKTLKQTLLGMSRSEVAARRALEQGIAQKATELTSGKVALRRADDAETALVGKTAHVDQVRQTMLEGIQQAKLEHQERLAAFELQRGNYRNAVDQLSNAGARLTVVTNEHDQLKAQVRQVTTDLTANRAQRDALTAQLAGLPPAPPTDQARAQAVERHAQAVDLLARTQQGLQPRQEALRVAQENLDAAKRQLRTARPFSQARNLLKAQVLALRQIRNDARVQLGNREALIQRCQTQVQQRTQALGDLNQQVRGATQRARIERSIQQLNQERGVLRGTAQALTRDVTAHQAVLVEAQTLHETAKEAEVTARIDMDRADRAQQASRERRDALERELPRLAPVAQALVEPTRQAQIEANLQRDQEGLRFAQKVTDLINEPPGFSPEQATPELKQQLRALGGRLHAIPAGLTADQAEVLARDRVPTEQAMEIVIRSLSIATRGQGADATQVLTDLMNRSFADLVPQPGQNFNGQPDVVGQVNDDNTAAKRAASLLAARPSGGELLKRLVQPGAAEPSRQLQDAVGVYFKATNAMSPAQTPDVPSMHWLQYAEQAAKVLAHPGDGVQDAAAMEQLNRLQRVAFNGVRNGFTSIAPGSAYDKANKAVEKFSDQWVTRAAADSKKTSPLHARELATKVAADVGLPTLENNLNKQLKIACNELMKITANELVQARARVGHARQQPGPVAADAPQPAVPQALLEAHNLLQYIQKRADRGERIDTLSLGKKAWRSVEKKTQQQLKSETTVQARPAGTLGEVVHHVRGQRPAPADGAAAGLGAQPEFDELAFSLLEIQATKPTVLQALQQIRDSLAGVATQGPTDLTPEEQAELDAFMADPAGPGDPVLEDLQRRLAALGPQDNALDAREQAELDALLAQLLAPAVDPAQADLQRRLDALRANNPGLPQDDASDYMSAASLDGDDDPAQADLQRRLDALRNFDPDPHEVADGLDPELLRRFNALRADQPAQPPADVDADLMRRLDALRGGQDGLLPQQARADWNAPLQPQAPQNAAGGPVDINQLLADANALAAEVDARVEEIAAALPPTPLNEALTEANTLNTRAERFRNSKGDFSAEALEQWMIPAITDAFGAVAVNHGRQAGVGSSGLVGVAAQISGAMGLVVRPDVDVNLSRKDQFKFGRDALGIELSVGRTHGVSVSAGASASLAAPHASTNDVLASGPGASITHTWTGTRTQGGAIIRAPKFDGKTHPDLTRDFSEMVSTALTWREPRGQDGAQLYEKPLDALLDRHQTISISTVESAKVFSHSASSSLVGFTAPSGPVGAASGLAVVSAGITSTNTQERGSFKTIAGTQGFVSTARGESHTLGINAGGALRAGYSDPDRENLAAVRGTLASVAASANLRKSSAQSGANIVRMPDGAILADRFVEYTSFEKFEAAVKPHREKWVQAAMKAGRWPDGFPESDKRIVAERTLDDFMAKAKASVKAGTVTLNETMDVKPEVCAELGANLALEELARLEGRHDDALALQAARQKVLEDDSSYQPFLLKAIARSSIGESKGLNFVVNAMSTKGASAAQVYDWFPRLGT